MVTPMMPESQSQGDMHNYDNKNQVKIMIKTRPTPADITMLSDQDFNMYGAGTNSPTVGDAKLLISPSTVIE